MRGFTSYRTSESRSNRGEHVNTPEIAEGAVFTVEYPFCRDVFETYDNDGPIREKTWRPGVRHELVAPDGATATQMDGLGAQILTVVSVHKPGRFPTRVFYTRKWRTPEGKEFGKSALRIKTLHAFKTLLAGYRYRCEIEPTSAEDILAEMALASNERYEVS